MMLGYIVQAFALAFVICGLAVVGISIWSMIELGNLSNLASFYLPVGIIVLGTVVSLLALMICGAARRKSKCLMTFTMFLLVCIILSQLGVTIALFVSENSLINVFQTSWIALGTSNGGTQTKIDIENSFKCCGWSNSTSVADAEALKIQQCTPSATGPPEWTDYCKTVINQFIDKNLQWISIAAAALLGIEFLGLFALICMCCGVRHAKEDYESEALISDARRRRDARKEVREDPRYSYNNSSARSDYMSQPYPARNQGGWEPL